MLPHRVRLRQCKYLNNVIEQYHRLVKKRTWLVKGYGSYYGSFQSAWRTLEGIETLNMIRKGRVRWVEKYDVVAELQFITKLFASLPNCLRPTCASAPYRANFAMKPKTLWRMVGASPTLFRPGAHSCHSLCPK